MSKSLEALEKFKLLYESKCKEQLKNLIGFDMCYITIKQDLERLEELEKENQELKEQLEINETLSNAFEKQAFEVLHNYEKLKKAIEILKEYNLTISYIPDISLPHLTLNDYGDGVTLTQEEYELLNEVFSNE